jgi:hypothetical protein
MVRKILLYLFLTISIFGVDTYDRFCVDCHRNLPTSLQEMFKHYLLVYGGEKNMKAGIKHYLKYPTKDISVMSDLFISNYGIKNKTTLSEDELVKAIDIYWNKFKVFEKLK